MTLITMSCICSAPHPPQKSHPLEFKNTSGRRLKSLYLQAKRGVQLLRYVCAVRLRLQVAVQ